MKKWNEGIQIGLNLWGLFLTLFFAYHLLKIIIEGEVRITDWFGEAWVEYPALIIVGFFYIRQLYVNKKQK